MPKPSYPSLVRPETFLGQYMTALKDTECPYAYDFWCGLWALSCACGRELYVPRPHAPVYLNLYLLLCANSGLTRKSTAVSFATAIAREFATEQAPHIRIVETKVTADRLAILMNEDTKTHGKSHLYLSISELATVMTRHNLNLPAMLTDLYDCPTYKSGGYIGTLTKSNPAGIRVNIQDVFVNFLAASTPAWLVTAVTPAVIEGGFTSRCLFIVEEDRKKRIPWPGNRDGASTHAHLVDALRTVRVRANQVAARYGGVQITSTALEDFSEWYRRRDEHRDPFRATFEAREDHHVLRLAALLSVNDERYEIQVDDIRKAIRVIQAVKETASVMFSSHTPVSKTIQGIDRIRSALLSAGRRGTSQTQLRILTQRYMDAAQMNTALAIMHELDLVQKFNIPNAKHYGVEPTLWRATRRLANRGALDLVMREMENTQ